MKNCNNFKLMNEIKSHKLTKLSFLGLLAVAWSIPCIKVQDNSKRSLMPVLQYGINYRFADDEIINSGVIVNYITYNSSTGIYSCYYSVPCETLLPYSAFYNLHFDFTLSNDNQPTMVTNYFDNVDTSEEKITRSVSLGSYNYFYIQSTYVSSQDDFVFDCKAQAPSTINIIENEFLDYGTYPNLVPRSQPGYTTGRNVYPLRLVEDATKTYLQGYSDGTNYGIQYVLEHLNDYNLYTQSEYLQYGTEQYNLGLNAGSSVLSLSGLVKEIFASPITMFKGIFNWTLVLPNGEVINVLPIMTFLLTIGIALAIIHLIMKIG